MRPLFRLLVILLPVIGLLMFRTPFTRFLTSNRNIASRPYSAMSDVKYQLLYHPGVPGRGEFVRLAFQAANVSYADPANDDPPNEKGVNGYGLVQAAMSQETLHDEDGNPPVFAPPALRVFGGGKDGKNLLIHQVPNILLYLGPKLGLVGEEEQDLYHVNQLALTALDLNDEVHGTHHPIASALYYYEQKDEALKFATSFRETRIPKFFSYFERALKGNQAVGKGKHLVGSKLTYADTTLWEMIEGLKFAFPKEMEFRSKEYPLLFDTFYPGIKEEDWLQKYFNSGKRLKHSMGGFRYYPELDRK